jgi:NMD protein affecting ribosome stability and mRNA decay
MGYRERMLVIGTVSVDRIIEAASCNVCCIYAIPNTRIDSLLQRGLASLVTHHQLARLRDLHLVCSLEVKVYRDRLFPRAVPLSNVIKSHALGAQLRDCGVLAGITDVVLQVRCESCTTRAGNLYACAVHYNDQAQHSIGCVSSGD